MLLYKLDNTLIMIKLNFNALYKKSLQISLKTFNWVEDRIRTGDPWYHKPML